MEDNLKVDKDYKEAFNLGYELAKELNLESPMFKDSESIGSRIESMQAGMAEYSGEIKYEKNNQMDKSQDFNSKKDKGTGLDFSI